MWFDEQHHLNYNPMLRPANHDDAHGLFVASKLSDLNPGAYCYAMDFACRNHLQVTEVGMPEIMPNVA